MRIRLWRGYHSGDLQSAIEEALHPEGDTLLILCPPLKVGLSFVDHLPASESIELAGSWDAEASIELESRLAKLPDENMSRPRYPERPILGVFTSGTVSGTPRLVLYTAENIEASLSAILEEFDRSRMTSIFCYPQPFHTFGLLLGYALSVKLGIPLTTPPGKYGKAAHALRCSLSDPGLVTLGAPVHFIDLLDFVRATKSQICPSYSCIVGGAPASVNLWRSLRDELKIEAPSIGYGCTEASPGITHLRAGREPSDQGEIGLPMRNLSSTVVPGEGLRISGASLCLAIIENNQLQFPQEVLIRDDIRIRADGSWLYSGRLDLVINRGGAKYSLEAIENSIRDACGIVAVAVGVSDIRMGQELALAIRHEDLSAQPDLKTRLASVLDSKFSIRIAPSHILAFDQFYLNESAKTDRMRLAMECSMRLQTAEKRSPIPVTELFDALPHRPPMVWIDEVIDVNQTGGSCRLTLKEGASYLTDGSLRPSSLIEFIAQSFGYVLAANRYRNPETGHRPVTKAFLISITGAKLENCSSVGIGQCLTIEVGNFRQVGPVTLFQGRVLTANGRSLALADLKVYSE